MDVRGKLMLYCLMEETDGALVRDMYTPETPSQNDKYHVGMPFLLELHDDRFDIFVAVVGSKGRLGGFG